MKLPKFEVDATNMQLVFSIDNNQKYSDWVRNAKVLENHMNWEIVGSNGNHLGVADYDFLYALFWKW